jgi:hypothetical protein
MSVHDPQVGEKFLAQLGEVFEITGRVGSAVEWRRLWMRGVVEVGRDSQVVPLAAWRNMVKELKLTEKGK